MKKLALILAILMIVPFTSALTFTDVDYHDLPLTRVFDPSSHENEIITKYSYEQLEYLMTNNLRFQRRNDMTRVCQSIEIMFDKVPARCGNVPEVFIPYENKPVTTYAEVSLTILPTPKIVHHPTIMVDPFFGPWHR